MKELLLLKGWNPAVNRFMIQFTDKMIGIAVTLYLTSGCNKLKQNNNRAQTMKLTPFHLAVQVRDIAEARDFYGNKLGFAEGRSAEQWIDFNMFGHQLVTHLNPALGAQGSVPSICNGVDGHGVPVPHFGVIMDFDDWKEFAEQAKNLIDDFIIEPYVRFAGEVGEQGTMFFADPSGNALEFKGFHNIEKELFAK